MNFRWPLFIGLFSMFGLVSARLDDGFYETLTWFALGVPLVLVVGVWARLPRVQNKEQNKGDQNKGDRFIFDASLPT